MGFKQQNEAHWPHIHSEPNQVVLNYPDIKTDHKLQHMKCLSNIHEKVLPLLWINAFKIPINHDKFSMEAIQELETSKFQYYFISFK